MMEKPIYQEDFPWSCIACGVCAGCLTTPTPDFEMYLLHGVEMFES